MFKLKNLLITAIAVVFLPGIVFAADYKVGPEKIVIGESMVVSDNLYLAGGDVFVSGTVNGDIVSASGNIAIDGQVSGDVISLAGDVKILGKIIGDVRVVGGKVNINGTVTGDVLAAGGDVMLENSGKIEGDMLVASGTAVLDGSVKKDLKVYSGDLKIRGLVGNDVYANASNISVSDTATINGNLKYTSSQSASIDSGSKIKGEVSAQIKKAPGVSVASRIFGFIYGYLAYVFLGTLFLWLFHKPIMRLSDTIYKENGQSFLYGVMAFFLAPIAIIVLFCTVIGIPIAIILLMVYVISILFSKIIVSLAGGRYIFEKLGFHKSEYFVLAGGLFVYLLLSNIPLIGFFVSLITWFLGLGSIFLALRRAHQP